MAKNVYVGGNISIPGEEITTTINITASNISDYFDVDNGSTYYFVGSGSTFTSNNKGKHSTTARTTLTAKVAMKNFKMTVGVSSESNYDKLIYSTPDYDYDITMSGKQTFTKESEYVAPGKQLDFQYKKDSSGSSGTDTAWFKDMSFEITTSTEPVEKTNVALPAKTIYVGVNGIARRAKKAYIGVNGVARIFWDDDLPYIPLTYIESTGTQYIDTGWKFGLENYTKSRIVADSIIGTASNGWPISGVGERTCIYYGCGANSRTIYYGNGSSDVSTGITYTEKRCIFDIDLKGKTYKTTEKDSGQKLVDISISLGAPAKSSISCYLFAYNEATTLTPRCHTERLYGCQIYEDDILIRDYVPARWKETGEIGLYDKVNKQFYGNAGSGSFTGE